MKKELVAAILGKQNRSPKILNYTAGKPNIKERTIDLDFKKMDIGVEERLDEIFADDL